MQKRYSSEPCTAEDFADVQKLYEAKNQFHHEMTKLIGAVLQQQTLLKHEIDDSTGDDNWLEHNNIPEHSQAQFQKWLKLTEAEIRHIHILENT